MWAWYGVIASAHGIHDNATHNAWKSGAPGHLISSTTIIFSIDINLVLVFPTCLPIPKGHGSCCRVIINDPGRHQLQPKQLQPFRSQDSRHQHGPGRPWLRAALYNSVPDTWCWLQEGCDRSRCGQCTLYKESFTEAYPALNAAPLGLEWRACRRVPGTRLEMDG